MHPVISHVTLLGVTEKLPSSMIFLRMDSREVASKKGSNEPLVSNRNYRMTTTKTEVNERKMMSDEEIEIVSAYSMSPAMR